MFSQFSDARRGYDDRTDCNCLLAKMNGKHVCVPGDVANEVIHALF